MRRPNKSKKFKLQKHRLELREIELLESWIEWGRPNCGSNPLSLSPLPEKSRIGKLPDGSFSRYAGVKKFSQLPLSKKTKDGLAKSKYSKMTDIQRASLPHSLCGRDILGAAKTGSGKTLAFIIPVLEKLYTARWGPEDGVGCIIMSPTRELANQIFEVLNSVGRYHNFSAGLLIGGRKGVETEKESINTMNILVCTPGRLLQHMDETPNFDCSQLQVLVLDEADQILDAGFKKQVNAIISQLPKHRQTLLFSATQTKSVQDLARLSLKRPEYLGVHEQSSTATPNLLQQSAVVVALDRKIDMLWSFLKAHLHSRILVFLSSVKQVRFIYEVFKKLRPGIPLKFIHGNMSQEKRAAMYSQFNEKASVLFATDVASRGPDFGQSVDWVVQVDCPQDVDRYIHRVGRTARYLNGGRALLFLTSSENKMLDKLRENKIPIRFTKANILQTVSEHLSALLVKFPDLQSLAKTAFINYLRSIFKNGDEEVFDVTKLPVDEFAASLGLPMTPKIRILKQKIQGKSSYVEASLGSESTADKILFELPSESSGTKRVEEDEVERDFLLEKDNRLDAGDKAIDNEYALPPTRVLKKKKKKKLKINVHRPVGTRVVFDEEGNALPPLAKLSDTKSSIASFRLDKEKVNQRFALLREEMKRVDNEDKVLDRQRRKARRLKEKMKRKRGRDEEDNAESEHDLSCSDGNAKSSQAHKKGKIYFDSDGEDGEGKKNVDERGINRDSVTLAEQEALALKLLSSMHP